MRGFRMMARFLAFGGEDFTTAFRAEIGIIHSMVNAIKQMTIRASKSLRLFYHNYPPLNQSINLCHQASPSRQLFGGFCPFGQRLVTCTFPHLAQAGAGMSAGRPKMCLMCEDLGS